MDPAHAALPQLDWEDPPPDERRDARLILPGNECARRVIGFEPGVPIATPAPDPAAPPTSLAEGEEPPPVQTTPGRAIIETVDVGTTIAPDNLDPNAPLPTVELGLNIGRC